MLSMVLVDLLESEDKIRMVHSGQDSRQRCSFRSGLESDSQSDSQSE